jgi:hypothetical protein
MATWVHESNITGSHGVSKGCCECCETLMKVASWLELPWNLGLGVAEPADYIMGAAQLSVTGSVTESY